MELVWAIILGIVEGATEFLPVSSTGHLIVVSQWLKIDQSETHIAFEIIIQLGAILAVMANYSDKFSIRHHALWAKLFVAFLPLALVGFLLKDQIEMLFKNPVIVPSMFIAGGFVFLIVERFYTDNSIRTKEVEDITYLQAFWVGLAQILALVPGTSRAGSTIVGSMLVGLSRKASAEFSFLLALPVMGAVCGYQFLKNYDIFSGSQFSTLIVGFITAFIVALLSMKLLAHFLENYTFVPFGLYRILFGAGLFWVLA